jgi:RNA polymerase sigma factor (sigma-70 family)
MDHPDRRTKGVNEALLETGPPLGAGAAAETFESLYRRTFPRVYAYVASLLRDRSAAEDVTAQAFERAYRKRASFRPSRGSAEAWLLGIARNAALDELRRRKRRARLEADPEDVHLEPVEEHADRAVRRETVRAALEALEPRERDMLALKFSARLSNAEIGRVLGMSESNAGTKLHRAIEKLRKACHD